MVFDFLGDKTKVVIAMAHIGALPGAPLYDADGGVTKLMEESQGHRSAASRRRRCDHVRQRERSPLCLQGAARGRGGDDRRRSGREAPSQGPVRRQLSLGPARQRRHCGCDRRKLRARDLHRPVRLRHGALVGRLRRRRPFAAQSRPRQHEAPVQHQRRVRPIRSRRAPDRLARQKRRVLLARRRDPRVRPPDRRACRWLGP